MNAAEKRSSGKISELGTSLSPLPPNHKHKYSLASENLSTAAGTPEPRIIGHSPNRGDEVSYGVISSVTSKYYLIKTKSAWVPILKANLLNPDSSSVNQETDFAVLKWKKVRVLDPSSYATCAILVDPDKIDTARAQGGLEELMPVIGRLRASSDLLEIEEGSYESLMEEYEELSVRLMTDVVALSKIVEKPGQTQRAAEFLSFEKRKIQKRVVTLITELERIDTPSSTRVKQVFLHLLHNLTASDQAIVTCEYCKVAKYEVRLSCGHKYCNGCQHKLVQKIMTGMSANMVKCFLCRTELTKVDQRLVTLEQYFRKPKSGKEEMKVSQKPRSMHIRKASQGGNLPYSSSGCTECTERSTTCPHYSALPTARTRKA